jgi:hypothetical protein
MKHLRWLAAALLLFTFVGSACGGDDDDSAAVGDDSSNTTAAEATPPKVTITASEGDGEYKFDVPKDIPGGVVTITVNNTGNKEVHDFQLLRLDGHSIDEVTKSVSDENAPMEKWLQEAVGVGSAPPGGSATATFALDPNTEYGFFCTESNEEKHLAHATHGMSGTFTTGEKSGAALPKTNATITTTEYKFAVDGLKSGKNTITFKNGGSMLHHVALIPFLPGKTLDDLKKAFESEDQSGPPPADFEHAVFSAVAGIGDTIVYDADLKPGHYAILCFMPDPGTAGPPHAMKGMIDELTIS